MALTLTQIREDPRFRPAANIGGLEARAYEEKIVELLRDHLLPNPGPVIALESIELRGERPDTEIIFRYIDSRKPGAFAVRALLWKDERRTSGAIEYDGKLNDASSVGSWLLSAWLADELDPVT